MTVNDLVDKVDVESIPIPDGTGQHGACDEPTGIHVVTDRKQLGFGSNEGGVLRVGVSGQHINMLVGNDVFSLVDFEVLLDPNIAP